MKKVSIIIPVYNTEKYLNKCIDSVVNQTYKNIEIIIINDGSKGNVDEIINEFKDKRIRYFKRTNHGIGASRNFGIEKSTGEFIVFLDSDDYLKSNAIETLITKAETDKNDIVICDYEELFENSNLIIKREVIRYEDCTLKDNPNLINSINLGPSNKIFEKELFSNNFFPEDIKYEDFALVLKLFDQAKSIGKINESLFVFLKHSKSETAVVDEKVFDIFGSLDEIRKYFGVRFKTEIDYLTIKICLLYATKQKYQKNKKIKNIFINKAYDYLKSNVNNYKNSNYFDDCTFLKRVIQKNILLMKIYINL